MVRRIGLGKLMCVAAVATTLCFLGAMQAFAGGRGVPFRGVFSGSALWLPDAPPIFHGAGIVTHMGLSLSDGVAIIEPPIDTDACEAGWGIPNLHIETLTAANGDMLVLEMDDIACPTGELAFHGFGVWHVVNGTGRFAGASGSGTVDGHSDFMAGTIEFTLFGEITY